MASATIGGDLCVINSYAPWLQGGGVPACRCGRGLVARKLKQKRRNLATRRLSGSVALHVGFGSYLCVVAAWGSSGSSVSQSTQPQNCLVHSRFVPAARVLLVSDGQWITKACRVSCDRGEGHCAQDIRRKHRTKSRSEERATNSARAGVSCVCAFEMQKKGRNQGFAGDQNRTDDHSKGAEVDLQSRANGFNRLALGAASMQLPLSYSSSRQKYRWQRSVNPWDL